MSRPKSSIIGARPTWTTTATSGIWTLRQAEEMKADGKWPRGPVAPTSVAGTGGNEQVALTWVAPANAHGTITDYVVEYTPAAGSPTVVATGSTAASYTVTGLTNDTEYTFRVAAVNHTLGDWSGSVAVTPSAGDPNFASVSLLLHMDGSNGSTTFIDSSNNAFSATTYGSVAISTTASKFGGASAAYSGGTTADGLEYADNAAFDFGTGDFSLECWAYLNGTPSNVNALIAKYGSGGNEWIWWVNNTGKLVFYTDGGNVTSSASVPTGQWTYLAATRSSSTLKLFIDGTEEASGTMSTDFGGSATLSVGNYPAFGTFSHGYGIAVDGYLDDVRITKGVARSITVPTAAFPDA